MFLMILALLASLTTIVGWIWITCSAGRDNLGWGLGCFFIGPLCLAYPFLTDRFQELKYPWFMLTFGFIFAFILPALGILG